MRAEVAESVFSLSFPVPPFFLRNTPPSTAFLTHTHTLCLSFSLSLSAVLFFFYLYFFFFLALSFFFGTCREEMPFQRNEVFRGSKVISLVQSKLSDFREPWRRNLPHRLPLLRSNPFTFPSFSPPLSTPDGRIRNVTKITLYLEIRGRSGHLKNRLV